MNTENSIIPQIRMMQEQMTVTERKVIDYLLSPSNFEQHTSLKEIADRLSVSEALIVKVAKILGFKGFRELRTILVEQLQSQEIGSFELSQNDSTQDLINKVFNLSYQTISEGKSIISPLIMEQAAKCFFEAKQRDLYAVGGSNTICDDIFHKFLRIGVRCNSYRDIHLMMMSASLLTKDDVVLVVSHSGKTSDLLRAIKIAKQNGAKIICITHSNISPIAALADFVICTPAPNTPLLGKNASARILQLILVDAFFVSVAKQDLQFSERNLEKTSLVTEYFRQK
ncbi:transcriptional repressor AlsR [Gallibacterium sp. AGMB14963]|uniref:transcriptional repressor AlsR n=1 Tax=Gallibacterium faecale TaxID=3019086 RepID=UPI0022F1B213|nr:MurR/RpiR family transcriptional regulator [Gallibacterium sp. AGMB14963]MDA3977719.1 MurR/RpiR family transcriptional regulator [Gallibacterium sp. AGMB14963]